MNYTLITGASGGIGEAIALELAKSGTHLILVGRSQDKLETLASSLRKKNSIEVHYFLIDLLEKDSADRIYEWCVQHKYFVNVLINNAGSGLYGKFNTLSLEEQLDMIYLNQSVLVSLCHNFVPMLQEAPNAHILNVASTAAYQPVPYMTIYGASKAFVLMFSRGLRAELKKAGIKVTCLCPGPTKTAFYARAGFDKLNKDFTSVQMTASQVATAAIEGMKRNKATIIPGFSNKLGAFLDRIVPVGFITLVTSRILRPKLPRVKKA